MPKKIAFFFFLVTVMFSTVVAALMPTTTASVTSDWTTICELNVFTYANFGFRIRNTGATNAFTDCRVQSFVGPGDDVAATGTLTMSGNAADTEIVTLDTKVYAFQASLTDVDGHVKVGADAAESLGNLIAAITLGSGSGSKYAASTTLHPTVTAATGVGDKMVATAKDAGAPGNLIATTETLGSGSFGDTALSGGVDAWTTLSVPWSDCKTLIPGAATWWTLSGNSESKIRVQAKSVSGTSAYCNPYGKK